MTSAHPSTYPSKSCPVCGSSIPEQAPGGFCTACLLRDAVTAAPAPATGAPSIDAVAAAFPNLKIEGLIGQGGMGFVYKAVQTNLERSVALKILAPELGLDATFAERFSREARMLGKLNHPNIVTIHETGQSGGFYYLLMEYVEGVNLRQAMKLGKFTPEQALAIVPGICDALQAAHNQGIWHRDIKPENILLDAQGQVKIADFGIARLVGDSGENFTLTRTGAVLGSAAYMSPEQHETPHDVDHRADIYSLGVVFYEMLTGELPLGRFKAPSSKSEVDARIDEIVFRTLEKERELRQQSAAELKTEVASASAHGFKAPKGPAEVPKRSSAYPKALRWLGAALLLCAVYATAHYFIRSRKPTAETWSYTLRKLTTKMALELPEKLPKTNDGSNLTSTVENGVFTVQGPRLAARRMMSMLRAVEQTLMDSGHEIAPALTLNMMHSNTHAEFIATGFKKVLENEKVSAPQLSRALSSHVWEWEKVSYTEHGEGFTKTLEVTVPCSDTPEKPLNFTISGWGTRIGKLQHLTSISPWIIDEAKTLSAEPFPEDNNAQAKPSAGGADPAKKGQNEKSAPSTSEKAKARTAP